MKYLKMEDELNCVIGNLGSIYRNIEDALFFFKFFANGRWAQLFENGHLLFFKWNKTLLKKMKLTSITSSSMEQPRLLECIAKWNFWIEKERTSWGWAVPSSGSSWLASWGFNSLVSDSNSTGESKFCIFLAISKYLGHLW